MKIVLLSKYPPIEGGVSTGNLWLARGLARRGHQVVVVTNADETEETCRLWIDEGQESWLEPSFSECGGTVTVLSTTSTGRSEFHVPWANPFVTKLTTLALKAIRDLDYELIFSYYLEPYSIAGHLAAHWGNVPHVITHAGSDIGRLARNPALGPTYLEIIHSATRFIPKNSAASAYSGVPRESARTLSAYSPPADVFNPSGPPLDVNALILRAERYIRDELHWHVKEFDPRQVTFGFYGKLLTTKGIHDLVDALRLLKQEGRCFNFLVMSRWRHGEEEYRESIRAAGLEACTWFLPPLPNWQVPAFLRRCNAVCYLNRHVPISQHSPIIPLEIAACGTCLVVSEEVRGKGTYDKHLRDLDTCVVVNDPTNSAQLAGRLRVVLDDPPLAARIGLAGHTALAKRRSYDEFITGWEAVLREMAAGGVS